MFLGVGSITTTRRFMATCRSARTPSTRTGRTTPRQFRSPRPSSCRAPNVTSSSTGAPRSTNTSTTIRPDGAKARLRARCPIAASRSVAVGLCRSHYQLPRRTPHYDDECTFVVQAIRDHLAVTIPFMDAASAGVVQAGAVPGLAGVVDRVLGTRRQAGASVHRRRVRRPSPGARAVPPPPVRGAWGVSGWPGFAAVWT